MPTQHPTTGATVKETIISIVIAFAMAFVFRGFVIEAFLIPTGSMAPTLLGQHMLVHSDTSGYDWTVGPWQTVDRSNDATPIQPDVVVTDPMSGEKLPKSSYNRRWGDRLFVMKYLYGVYEPKRFDVVVFKNTTDPTVNYIKRLVGLPDEMTALIDGDVFARKRTPGDEKAPNPWALPGWSVQRKPERVQLEVWQPIFSSEYAPLQPQINARTWVCPWLGVGAGKDGTDWRIGNSPVYAYTGAGPTMLEWRGDTQLTWGLYDYTPYNQGPRGPADFYPVGDLRLRVGVHPDKAGLGVSAVVQARHHYFRARISGAGAVTLEMRPEDPASTPWTQLGTATLPEGGLPPDRVTDVEFWHVDQTLRLLVGGKEVCRAEYQWTPDERLRYAVGLTSDELATRSPDFLTRVQNYAPVGARFEFEGGSFTLHRVGIDRDIFYRPSLYSFDERGNPHTHRGSPALATHPSNTAMEGPDDFFFCGDNSAASLDARLWDKPNPWIADLCTRPGYVNRALLTGKAFFVYFPSPYSKWGLPVPDFGDMRLIW